MKKEKSKKKYSKKAGVLNTSSQMSPLIEKIKRLIRKIENEKNEYRRMSLERDLVSKTKLLDGFDGPVLLKRYLNNTKINSRM